MNTGPRPATAGPGARAGARPAPANWPAAPQHETDHLRGKLYIDDLTGAERRRVMRHLTARVAGATTCSHLAFTAVTYSRRCA
jgi:hypothetical protein